ncbi:hypothetical protein F0562_012135 [Nyssa sinensis]|uniref:Uncharacterized protein n=1 Tax=Nyssa sinensis TaxID=561372 RepID=A0A5J4ZRW4_9ASTE|nr:hypothetical protein F0562_012135 [Nyssa sinensis]
MLSCLGLWYLVLLKELKRSCVIRASRRRRRRPYFAGPTLGSCVGGATPRSTLRTSRRRGTRGWGSARCASKRRPASPVWPTRLSCASRATETSRGNERFPVVPFYEPAAALKSTTSGGEDGYFSTLEDEDEDEDEEEEEEEEAASWLVLPTLTLMLWTVPILRQLIICYLISIPTLIAISFHRIRSLISNIAQGLME